MVIMDECHAALSYQAFTVINAQCAKYRFGLSATPQRRDDLEAMIHAALGEIVASIEAQKFIGAVLPVSIVTKRNNISGLCDSWNDFTAAIAKDHNRNALLVKSAIKSSQRAGAVVLTGTIAHAEHLAAMVSAQGCTALLLHGQLPSKERHARMAQAHDTPLIIGTLSLLSEGIDWPHVGAIIFGAPLSACLDKDPPAATRLIQAIGRARRPHGNKQQAYIRH